MHWGMIERFGEYSRLANGKFYIIAVDRHENDDSWIGSYETEEAALKAAEAHTTNSNITKLFLAYNPKGRYIGDDSWEE